MELTLTPSPAVLDVLGVQTVMSVRGEHTGGACAAVELVVPPGAGTPPHVHSREEESFVVLAGTLELRYRGRWHTLPTGGSAVAPRGVAHCFRNPGAEPCRVLVLISPAGFEKFFDEVDAASHRGPPSMEQVMTLGERYGLSFPPDA